MNKITHKLKKIRPKTNINNIFHQCCEEMKNISITIGLMNAENALNEIAKRAIILNDPIIIEELINLKLLSITENERIQLLKKCKEINPIMYNYDI